MFLIQQGKLLVPTNFKNKQTNFKINESQKCGLYVIGLLLELILIHQISDLPSSLGNWVEKSAQIFNLKIPTSNFYGPGAALLMVPFHYFPRYLFFANLFYFGLGSIAYWKLVSYLKNPHLKMISLISLPANFYLVWLINSSQDTVFEFCLLAWSLLFLIRKKYIRFALITFLLCLTRSGYWAFFALTSITIIFYIYRSSKKVNWKLLLFVPLLLFTSVFNYVNYGSPSLALESGVTAYFSYTKYHYLALPKMDMDVFLSGHNGSFSREFGPNIPDSVTESEENQIFQRAAIDSMFANKKETLLGWMQKFDAYIFDVQKVPHLPGRYVLNQKELTINIENERLTWPLVIGNFFFLIWRSTFLLALLLSVGIFLTIRYFFKEKSNFECTLWPLAFPYVVGIIPGLLFYTESRFKVVSEVLLVPLILQIWGNLKSLKAKNL